MKKARTNILLFVATVASVFTTAYVLDTARPDNMRLAAWHAVQFTSTLLAILLAHEFGHYFAAKWHKVDASLPYFIPLPLVSPFGTMGAVIRMQGTIARRAALLDIGASGPLAGLVLAIPLYAYGLHDSTFVPRSTMHGLELGESILLKTLEHFFARPVPDGMELELSPIAFAAWAGMFVTMINLLPVGQLDGGHVAFALFGKRQDGYARIVHRLAPLAFVFAIARPVIADVRAGLGIENFAKYAQTPFWLVWFLMLPVLGSLSRPRAAGPPSERNYRDEASSEREPRPGQQPPLLLQPRSRIAMLVGFMFATSALDGVKSPVWTVGAWLLLLGVLFTAEIMGGTLGKHDTFDHPPTEDTHLGWGRRIVGVVTLVFFVLLFMPSPMTPV